MANGITTLGDIRLAAQRRADMENSAFVGTAEWTSYINASYAELYDLLIQKFGNDYFVSTPYAFTATGGTTQLYALPATFYKAIGLDAYVSGQWITLKPFMFSERNNYNFTPGIPQNLRYRINGNNLMFVPAPQAGTQFQLWFSPRPTTLVADADTVDGVSGWEEYVVVDAAIKAMQKEESDVSVLMAQKEGLRQRIEAAAENRDVGSPQTVSDVLGTGYAVDPYGWTY